jgi:formylglycine-generating enzyme required for sulfatase activity
MWLIRGDEFQVGEGATASSVELASFYISKAVITNEELEAWQPGRRRLPSSPGDEDPAVGVSFREALGYCAWYAEVSGKPFRLPTEMEWEFACSAGDRQRYYWGEEPAAVGDHAWTRERAEGHCREAAEGTLNPQGLYNMIGNTWEWTSSLDRPGPHGEGDGRDDTGESGPRVIRGGSFRDTLASLSARSRQALEESECRDDLGFRIVRSL